MNHIVRSDEPTALDAETVKVIDIDSLTMVNKPTLIKIDVEGFETEVLKGMASTLKQPSLKAIIIELNGSGGHYNFNETAVHQNLLVDGFKPYQYNPFERKLTILSSFGNNNTIYCRNIDFIDERIKKASSLKVLGETI